MILYPFFAKRRAIAFPKPAVAPVIIIVLFIVEHFLISRKSINNSIFAVLKMNSQPHNLNRDKKTEVESMFDSIAWRYDFLNHFLSLGIDNLWRRRAIRIISESFQNPYILDVATGTCDLAIAAMRIKPSGIKGIDISQKMLDIGNEKIRKRGFDKTISLMQADSENIPFDEAVFDIAMVAFGVRNFADPLKGLSEMRRVLRNDGMIMVLEFSKPEGFPFRTVFNFYFRNILPIFGRLFSKDKSAYSYLPDSVMRFPDNESFLELLTAAGFSETRQLKLTGGVASIYTGIKKNRQ
jgi:demethylmenaquinone methyltransferase/2-methoxy-6-polyprenyl-1,4-benzoquinol methylase